MAPAKTQPALLGGLVIGVLSALPVINFANCCCAWILLGGGLAAYLMQQNHPEPVNAGDGALAGLFAGIVGAFVWLAVTIPLTLLMSPFQSGMIRRILARANDMPPEFRTTLEGLVNNSGRIGFGIIFFFFIMLFVSGFFGMIGGLFGALLFRKNAPPPPPPPPIPPPSFTPPNFPAPDFPAPPIPGEERR